LKLFSRKENKAVSDVYKLMVTSPNQEASISINNFYNYVKEAYKINPFIYAAVNLIARTVAGIKLNIYENDNDNNLQIVNGHPLNNILDNANEYDSFSYFINEVVVNLYLSGNAYIHKITKNDGSILEVYSLNPGAITVLQGDGVTSKVGGYKYQGNSGTVVFEPQEILHIKFYDPLNDFYGMSPITSIAWTIQNMNDIHKFNTKLIQNSARPEGAFVVDTKLTSEQFSRLRDMINEKYTGIFNAGRPLLLEGGIDFKPISMTPADLNLIEIINHNSKEIALALGVPEVLLGGEYKTFNNYKEARQGFYIETILPLTKQLVSRFNSFLLTKNDVLKGITIDYEEPDAFKEDINAVWTRGLDALRSGAITINEFRQMVGFDKITSGDILLTPASSLPEPVEQVNDLSGDY
jgi:HK97 family phage portal protein